MSEQRYRFVGGSAEEAVSVLRQRFGQRARVVSVRQVEGKGLARFLQAPKLEVIAAVGEAPPPPPVQEAAPPRQPEAEAPVHVRTVVTEMPQPENSVSISSSLAPAPSDARSSSRL